MRVAELSRVSGVPVATIKYYLRERLLQPGTPTAPNQAEYDDAHVHRLRLVRVLREVGGLGIAAVRQVVDALADPDRSLHEVLGVAHRALTPAVLPSDAGHQVVDARREVDAFLAARGWRVGPDAPSRAALAEALVALRRLGRDVGVEAFEPYARAADELAAGELRALPAARTRADAVEAAVVGTVVYEAVLVALRRLAQEHHSALRFGGAGSAGGG